LMVPFKVADCPNEIEEAIERNKKKITFRMLLTVASLIHHFSTNA
jgi:hypothetical protein